MTVLYTRIRSALGDGKVSPVKLGVIFIIGVMVMAVVLFQKDRIITTLRPGDTIKVHFAEGYRLDPYFTRVKVAGVRVGRVSGVEQQPDRSAIVSLKIDNGIRDKLGSAPSATIRPTTLLGGNYYVDLVPGGDQTRVFTGVIPPDRTEVPVELDKIAQVLQPNAVRGMRKATERLDETLRDGGRRAFDKLAHDVPDALAPAAEVLSAARGTRGQQPADLSTLVRNMNSVARVMTERDGQLDAIVHNLHVATSALGRRSDELSTAVARLPDSLDSTDRGMRRLDTTLAKLRSTADAARPAARELNTVIDHASPVLAKARPFVRDLKDVVRDARPLIQVLVPTSQRTRGVLDDIRGPVLDRVNGPIKNMIMSEFNGTGPYKGSGGTGKPFYQELGYMWAVADRGSKLRDGNGVAVAFQPGLGSGTIAGLPISLEQLYRNIFHYPNPDAPQGKEGGR